MVSQLAKGDFEDLIKDGLKPSLEDFDRLNQIALRLTDGAETTAHNFQRIGWAGDVPFYQPTCAAFAWYLQYAERADFDVATKDACWFYALAHGRNRHGFDCVTPDEIRERVTDWLGGVCATREEIARACRYAAVGFEDAQPARADSVKEVEARKTDAEKREDTISKIEETVTITAARTGIAPDVLMRETPDRLARMADEARMNNALGGGAQKDISRLQADYDLTLREIRKRLTEEAERGK